MATTAPPIEFVSASNIEAFANLFKGRTDAWGGVEGLCNKEPVTLEHYRRHLEGKTSLGVYMLLDDGKCWFAAADLDEKDIDKILKVKEGFAEIGVHAYPCYSKGKGFHCYVFADKEPFDAHEIRRLFVSVLSKLSIECEIFPKQDKLDEKIPLGNYINLPCFGMTTRMFFRNDKSGVSVEQAMALIQRNSMDTIAIARKTIPDPAATSPVAAPAAQSVKVKGRPKKIKTPVCVEQLLKGVAAGSRDVAAFALSRWYLEQNYLPEEVVPYLELWDAKNKPPIGDSKVLLTKIQSAAKGYGVGCGSITGEPLLAGLCPGEAQCVWLKEREVERKKNGLIKELSFHQTDTHYFEQIYKEGKVQFVSYEKSTGTTQIIDSIEYPSHTIIPVHGDEIAEKVILFPTGVSNFQIPVLELEEQLVGEISSLIYDYVELPEDKFYWIIAHYVMLTWVYDTLNTVSYLRFRGDTGVGKSRALTVVGGLCYKPLMMSGAITPAPIYREIKRFRGTVILEEADFADTSEKSEAVNILNCGMEVGRAVLRCSPDDPNIIEVLPVFGPKLFATRGPFHDKALEARCTTIIMREAKRRVPTLINKAYESRASELRKKLLLWRFLKLPLVDPEISEDIDLETPDLKIEQRIKQMALPIAIVFNGRPGFIEKLREHVAIQQENIVGERSDTSEAEMIRAILNVGLTEGRDWITSKSLAEILQLHSNTIAAKMKNLGFKKTGLIRHGQGKRERYMVWDNSLIKQLAYKYIADPKEEFGELMGPEKIDLDI